MCCQVASAPCHLCSEAMQRKWERSLNVHKFTDRNVVKLQEALSRSVICMRSRQVSSQPFFSLMSCVCVCVCWHWTCHICWSSVTVLNIMKWFHWHDDVIIIDSFFGHYWFYFLVFPKLGPQHLIFFPFYLPMSFESLIEVLDWYLYHFKSNGIGSAILIFEVISSPSSASTS